MDEVQRYMYETQGVLIVTNAVDADSLAQLRAIFDAHAAKEAEPELSTVGRCSFPRWLTADGWEHTPQHLTDEHNMLHWGKVYRDLLTSPVIDPILRELLTPQYRLDHIYGTLLADGCAGQGLHAIAHVAGGGMYNYNAALGGFQNGMVVVAFELEDILPGDGGFGCIVRAL